MGDMTILAPSRVRELMPGSFSPEDFIDFYEPPFEDLVKKPSWKHDLTPVSWSASNLPDIDISGLEWPKYSPPTALRKVAGVTSWLLQEIVETSIDNVKARIAEGDVQERERKQRKIIEAKTAALSKGKEPYLPIIIAQDREDASSTGSDTIRNPSSTTSLADTGSIGSQDNPLAKAEKRRRFLLRRLFHRSNEKGESSSVGSAREAALKAQGERHGETRSSLEQMFLLRRIHRARPPTPPEEFVECVSCLDDFRKKDVIRVPCHSYCRDCFVRLVSAAVQNEQQWPPKCCLNEIPFWLIVQSIPSNLKRRFENRAREWEIPISERIYCSYPDCDLVLLPDRVDLAKQRGRCVKGHETCTICRGRRHAQGDCPDDPDISLTNRLAEEEGWRRCYNCKALVEHKEACQHMTCRCGTEFCYVCSQRWRTCDCTMKQLEEVKSAAETRREQRLFKEQTDAEELRQILLQIEEAEREEALRAELLRQEQLRIEEERRQRELEERVVQESFRRREVELKYQELRVALDQVHELQQVLLDMDQEKEAEEMLVDIRNTKDKLARKHATDRNEKTQATLASIEDKEGRLDMEFQLRAAVEHGIEEQYHHQLRDYWQDKRNGEKEVEAAMFALRKQMDQNHFAWQQWRSEKLMRYRARLEDERTVLEELIYSAAHRLDDVCVKREADMMLRMAAEKKWMHEVVVEREKLLAEWEVSEVEGDADSLFAAE